MASRKDVKSRIASVKNIHKITRAMEMVAAARLRRAEQRIESLRPYAQAIRELTRQVADAAPERVEGTPLLERREKVDDVAVQLVTGDRGLAGSFNTQIIREGMRLRRGLESEGATVHFSAVGRRGSSSLQFRGEQLRESYVGFTDRPAFTDARRISRDLIAAFVDGEVDHVDIVYNRYVSPLTQYVRRQRLLPLDEAEVFGEGVPEEAEPEDAELAEAHRRALWIYEPEAEEILELLYEESVELPGLDLKDEVNTEVYVAKYQK